MAGWAGMTTGARGVAVLLGGTVAGLLGFAVWQGQQSPAPAMPAAVAAPVEPAGRVGDATVQAAPATGAEATAVTAPDAGVTAPAAGQGTEDVATGAPEVAAPEAAPELVAEAAPDPVAPALDVVRVDADGAALIAGKAGANARVSLRLDGIEEAVTQADSAGNFVAQFTLQANPSPRMLTVAVLLDDGGEVRGGAAVAIAPIAAPALVADAEPVLEPEAPAAIMVTEDAVSIVQDAGQTAGAVPANVTVDAISYAPDGAVLLSGKGDADARLQLYLDNVAVMEAAAGADGKWAVTLPDTAPGIYMLRVDQLGPDGAVTSRFETPFKRETREALALASGQVADTVPVAEEAAAGPETAVVAQPVAEAAAVADPVVAEVAAKPSVEPEAEPVAEAAAGAADVAAVPQVAAAAADAVIEPAPKAVEATAPVLAEPTENSVATATAPVPTAPVTITVQPGFTLWGIADTQLGDGILYVQVFEMNRDKIRDPDLIYPGQVFMVPQE